jgi:nicotinamide-nucleotide amidase
VGTELLLGQISNTNAQKISRALAGIGLDVFFHTVVGDNLRRMTEVIETAAARSDVVIMTGGLGPTPDDITREAVAAALGRRLVRHDNLAQELRRFFERRGRAMPEQNLQQADLPDGATPIPPEGTAPGFYVENSPALVIALPGVPWEMENMLKKAVLPLLQARAGKAVTVSREVMVVGLGESHTHELISDLVDAQTNPTIAYLAGHGLVRVRLTCKAPDETRASELIEPIETEIRRRLGDAAVTGDGSTLAEIVGNVLRARRESAATAESLTGGLIGAELTKLEGASDFFLGSIVAYSNAVKERALRVSGRALRDAGPVSEEVAAEMAVGAAAVVGADLGIAATGVAGPAQHAGQRVGTIFVGAAYGGDSFVRKVHGYGDRDNVRGMAVTSALDLARRVLQGKP